MMTISQAELAKMPAVDRWLKRLQGLRTFVAFQSVLLSSILLLWFDKLKEPGFVDLVKFAALAYMGRQAIKHLPGRRPNGATGAPRSSAG